MPDLPVLVIKHPDDTRADDTRALRDALSAWRCLPRHDQLDKEQQRSMVDWHNLVVADYQTDLLIK